MGVCNVLRNQQNSRGFDAQMFLHSRFWFCCGYCCPYFCFAINGAGGYWIGLGQLSRAAALPGDCIFPVNMLIILGNYESVKCSCEQWGWVDYKGKCSQDFLYQVRAIIFGGR